MDDDAVFMSNLKGSAAANIVTGVFILCLWILKNKCKHSQCKMNNCCFTCSIKEDDEECPEKGRMGDETLEEIEVRVHKMYQAKYDGILQEHKTAIPTD